MNIKRLNKFQALAVCAVGVALAISGSAMAAWPEKPVTIIVPAGAGGGTDATARMLATRLEQKFKQPFNVVNMGEGGGVVGITKFATSRPDGYTLGILYNYAHYKEMGQTTLSMQNMTPIAQYNFDPGTLTVGVGSPYKDAKQLVQALKDNPGKFNISCGGGCGGSWPLAFAGLMAANGVAVDKLQMIPSQGAAAGMLDLASGTIDVIPCSLPETAAMSSAGKTKSLLVMASSRIPSFPDVPTVKEALGQDFISGAWRGVVGPAGLPKEIVATLEKELKLIVDDPAFIKAMADRGFGIQWRSQAQFTEFMKAQEIEVAKLISALGLAKK
jgi:tripartite-type tricarboxylate transporter receptor subunit TctC